MTKKPKNPDGRSSTYLGADGCWHGRVTMGVLDNGKPDRRHVKRKSKTVVVDKVRELESDWDSGQARKPGRKWTVEAWLLHWLENIARPHLRSASYSAYRVGITKHLIPGVGAHKLDRLQPEHLERLYARMIDSGSKPGTAHQAHRTARTAFGEALRRGHIKSDPAAIARSPRLSDEQVEPFSLADVQKIMDVASKRRNSALGNRAVARASSR